jgi:hypothetical protein
VLVQAPESVMLEDHPQRLQSRDLLAFIGKNQPFSGLELVQRPVDQVAPQADSSSLLVFGEIPSEKVGKMVDDDLAGEENGAVLSPAHGLGQVGLDH